MTDTADARSFIAGSWRVGDPRPRENPANPKETVATIHAATPHTATMAVEFAASHWVDWADRPAPERGRILFRVADILSERAPSIGRNLAREEGKTLAEAVGETQRASAIFRYFAAQTVEPDGETYPSHFPETLLYARREPLGVVVAITPWNFPIALPAWKIAPALAYGNAVVWKPAELVPLTSVALVEALLAGGVPPGAVNLVLGSGASLGDALLDERHIAAVTFTGSNAVGRAIQARATDRNIRVQLEMGGKNPAIVLEDADLDQAAELVARGAFLSAGQKCTATSRAIVDERVFDAFTERLARLAKTMRVGDPLADDTQVGPLVSRAQLETVLGYLRQAHDDGGYFVAGDDNAGAPGTGYYVRPTVVTGLDGSSSVVRDEIFGPVVAILPVGGPAEALDLANDTPFGLSASVFTGSIGSALRFAHGLRAGVIKVNQESAGVEFQVPFGGQKASSSGSREQGKTARDFFTQWKTVYIDPPSS